MTFRKILALVTLTAVVIASMNACSDDKGSNNNPPQNQREFASGDLSTGESYQHTFNTARTMNYYCAHHGGPGRQGMSGTITVTAAGTPDLFEISIVASTLPNLTVPVGSTIKWTNNHVQTHTVQSDD